MSNKDDVKNHSISSSKAEVVKKNDSTPPSSVPVKTSYFQTILAKKKAALELAQKAYEDAFKKCESELGKICIECGLGDYDHTFLREQFLKLAVSFPKRSGQEK